MRATWFLQGPLVDSISGTWHLAVGLESIGTGPELTSPAVAVAYTSGTRTGAPGSPGRRSLLLGRRELRRPGAEHGPGPRRERPLQGRGRPHVPRPTGTPGPFAAVYELPMLQIFDSPVLPNN